jgi:hypothetical protein
MAKGQIWKKGLSYESDVKRIEEAFPKLEEDMILPRERLAELIHAEVNSNRFYGVTASYRKKIRHQTGLILNWTLGGLIVLNPGEHLQFGEKKLRQGIRQTGRAIGIVHGVQRERLNETTQKRFDHQIHITQLLSGALLDAKRQLRIDLVPIKSLPEPTLVANGK